MTRARARARAMSGAAAFCALGLLPLLLAAEGPAATPPAVKPLEVGDAAPPFRLQGSDGKTYALADFKGKKTVVLAWFPKAFTGG